MYLIQFCKVPLQSSVLADQSLLIHRATFMSLTCESLCLDQGRQPILLNPEVSLRDHGITTTRVLALKPRPFCNERLSQHQIRLPDWVHFHQCWLSIVQGNHPCSLQDAIQVSQLFDSFRVILKCLLAD